jgi:hypothetical protein
MPVKPNAPAISEITASIMAQVSKVMAISSHYH